MELILALQIFGLKISLAGDRIVNNSSRTKFSSNRGVDGVELPVPLTSDKGLMPWPLRITMCQVPIQLCMFLAINTIDWPAIRFTLISIVEP